MLSRDADLVILLYSLRVAKSGSRLKLNNVVTAANLKWSVCDAVGLCKQGYAEEMTGGNR